jgi:hypothetical protein
MHTGVNGMIPRVTVSEPPKAEAATSPVVPPAAFRWSYAGFLLGGLLALPLLVILAAATLGLGFRVFMKAAGL